MGSLACWTLAALLPPFLAGAIGPVVGDGTLEAMALLVGSASGIDRAAAAAGASFLLALAATAVVMAAILPLQEGPVRRIVDAGISLGIWVVWLADALFAFAGR